MNYSRRLLLVVCLISLACFGAQAQDALDPYADMVKSRSADGAFLLGDASADVKLIEFSDFLCTSCQNYAPIIKNFIRDHVATGQAQFEYRMFPVIDAELSASAANLAECADTLQPGSFWRAHDLMFELVSRAGFTDTTVSEFASALGHEAAALQSCAANAQQVIVDAAYGTDLGVSATPSLFVQYGEAAPLPIALALPEHFPAIVDALRPQTSDPVMIEHGRYAGIRTWRRADGGFVLGEPDAPVTIVAFEDFLCPHCQTYTGTLHSFVDAYVRTGQAQLEYRFYPLVNPQYSTLTARVAECAAVQSPGSFWDAHDLLFEFAAAGSLADIETHLADLLYLDADALQDCIRRSIQLLVDTQLGQSAGVSGTPAVRARADNGPLEVIFAEGQPVDRGGPPLDVLSALLAGTGDVTIGAPERSLLNDNFLADASLVTAEPCGPPCWQGIVPGQTSLDAAAEIIAALDGITILNADERGLLLSSQDGGPCCQIASIDGELVASILLQFAPQISISEVIAVHGEPPFVSGQPFTDAEAALSFYYPDSQMLLYVVVPGVNGQLQATSPVVSAIYATEEVMRAAMGAAPFDYWKGYLTYGEYMDGEYDYTP